MKKSIAILTPAYNRAETLKKLYESLKEQTCCDFLWLIVDDGSQDKTREVVSSWQAEKKIEIVYFYKSNGGKHTALNEGIARVENELTFIVDSDDYLPNDAIELILNYHKKYKPQVEDLSLCGYSFLRCHSDGKVNTAYFPENEKIETYLQARINGGIGGDKAEVFYTDILREYPFPIFDGEKFLPEDVVWMRMSEKYNMVHINEKVYYCDYLEDGLTKSGRRMKFKSPSGMCLRSEIYLNNKDVCIKVKIKMMILYIIYGKIAGKGYSLLKKSLSDGTSRLIYPVLFLPALAAEWIWKKKYS